MYSIWFGTTAQWGGISRNHTLNTSVEMVGIHLVLGYVFLNINNLYHKD